MTSKVSLDVKQRLEVIFQHLNAQGAAQALPGASSLSHALEMVLRRCRKDQKTVHVDAMIARLFATAGVEAWQRGVHSFLISASLTNASPIWASVSGYYSSHYCVRGLAHLLGNFQVFHLRKRVCLESSGNVCTLSRSKPEHRFYWEVVKDAPNFAPDPLFTNNAEEVDESDSAHRNHANYADHLWSSPQFRPLDEQMIRKRVRLISQIPFTTPPIPRKDGWPDLESVQIVAYHRIVTFRRFLDEVLGHSNRFWNVHRNPPWTAGIIDFQLTEQAGLRSDRVRQDIRQQ